ncbi:hypothetical protein LTS08_004745 [Lithohypha guttulata]|nr:hypothetical protein LTS08_004745 [Lithohypha guttulata]
MIGTFVDDCPPRAQYVADAMSRSGSSDGSQHVNVHYEAHIRHASAAPGVTNGVHELGGDDRYDFGVQTRKDQSIRNHEHYSPASPGFAPFTVTGDLAWNPKEAEMQLHHFQKRFLDAWVGAGEQFDATRASLKRPEDLSVGFLPGEIDNLPKTSHELDMFRQRHVCSMRQHEEPAKAYRVSRQMGMAETKPVITSQRAVLLRTRVRRDDATQHAELQRSLVDVVRDSTKDLAGVPGVRQANVEIVPIITPSRARSEEYWSTCAVSLSETFSGLGLTENVHAGEPGPFRQLVPLVSNTLITPMADTPAQSSNGTMAATSMPYKTSEYVGVEIPEKTFACMFYINDPRQNRSCAGRGWRKISLLKEHLKRQHLRPVDQCLRCRSKFRSADEKNEHTCEETRSPTKKPMLSGTLNDEAMILRKKRDHVKRSGQSEEDEEVRQRSEAVWMKLYRAQFGPNARLPKSPYVDDIAEPAAVEHLANTFAVYPEARRLIQEKFTAHVDTNMALPQATRIIIEQALEVGHEVHEDQSINVNGQDTNAPIALSGSTLFEFNDLPEQCQSITDDWLTESISGWDSIDLQGLHYPPDSEFQGDGGQ